MKAAHVLALVAIGVTKVIAEGVTSAISPEATAPAGCDASFSGKFEVTVVKVAGATKRDNNPIAKRTECSGEGILVNTLEDGILTDAKGRTGYIASNFQFQYDDPPQAGAIYTAGFSACGNGSLALGGSAVWYECASGDFYNLYDRHWAAQCDPVEIVLMACGSSDDSGSGQVVGTQVVTTTIVSALSDGQPQVKTTTTGVPVCQISQIADGQVQVGTTPCASITTTTAATSTAVPVSQYSDGQIQVTPPASIPTVTSAPATETTSVVAGTTPAASESGSSVVVPTETLPTSGGASASASASTSGSGSAPASGSGSTSGSASGSASGSTSGSASGTTLATTATGTGASSASTPAGATGTSAPASSGAGHVQMSSLGALFLGLIGAVAFL